MARANWGGGGWGTYWGGTNGKNSIIDPAPSVYPISIDFALFTLNVFIVLRTSLSAGD